MSSEHEGLAGLDVEAECEQWLSVIVHEVGDRKWRAHPAVRGQTHL